MVDVGWYLLGVLVLLLGTDALAKGLAALCARRAVQGHAFALGASALNAIVPALAIVIAACVVEARALALGSLVGGAIAQLGLVLGLAALLAPLHVRLVTFARVVPILALATILLGVLVFDGQLGVIDAAVLGVATLLAVVLLVRAVRGERAAARALFAAEELRAGAGLLLVRSAVGLVLVGTGAWLVVRAALGIAAANEVGALIIGLLLLGPAAAVAGLPSALAAARRGLGDFAVGQALLGALACVLALPAVLALAGPLPIGAALARLELPALLALGLAVYPMMRNDGELSRREGFVLLVAFAAFIVLEILLLRA